MKRGYSLDNPEDVARLPQWAQRQVKTLQNQVKNLKAELSTGPEDSDTFANPYLDHARPLGRGTRVRFGGLDHTEANWDVHLRSDGQLEVVGGGSYLEDMVIQPRSTNMVLFRYAERK